MIAWQAPSRAAVVALTTLATSVLSGCGPPPQAQVENAPPEVTVVTVHRQPVPVITELPGRTSAYLIAQVRARVDGILLERQFKEGADVEVNQPLYQIDPAPYRAALESAQAQLARARANLESTRSQAERDRVLVEGNAVSRQAYIDAVAAERQAVADVAAARAAVTTAGINLGYTSVAAPISGRIGPSAVTQGAYVQASAATLLATIQQIDPIYVDLNQTSVDALSLRRQMAEGRIKLSGPDQATVRLTLEDGTEYEQPGRLEFTDITVDPGTGTVTVRALFPNPRHILLPGMFVRARIEAGVQNQAVLVPQEGLTRDRTGRATVMVVRPDNKLESRIVDATRMYRGSWVVDSGLQDGERVAVSGLQRVQPGMLVRAVPPQNKRAQPAGDRA
ncbi:MAG: efflux RND transporter periplasmic adaptor subunit [Steroidobacteraceae bacterium]|nr:efflux RND transporter periplasmic adaptor subunit [Steroidobacteraceae bacterium]